MSNGASDNLLRALDAELAQQRTPERRAARGGTWLERLQYLAMLSITAAIAGLVAALLLHVLQRGAA